MEADRGCDDPGPQVSFKPPSEGVGHRGPQRLDHLPNHKENHDHREGGQQTSSRSGAEPSTDGVRNRADEHPRRENEPEALEHAHGDECAKQRRERPAHRGKLTG